MLREPDEFLHERYATNNCSINDMDDEFEWLEDSTSVEKECNEVVNVEPNIFGNESKNEPKVGMLFSSKEEVYEYYRKYAKDSGFGIYRRSSTSDEDGLTKYDVIVCFRAGKSRAKCNLMKPNLLTKTECQAKVRATLQLDGAYMLTKVVLEHNHGLSPVKARYFRSNKKLDDHVKRRLELNDQAGIGVGKNFNSLVVEAGGYENLSFVEKDCRNYIEKARKLRLGEGDALAIHNYFVRMQEQNPSFFYVIDFDSDSRIRNLFWVDARSRAAYESFGDVVSFDTTYLTNKYDMPFAPFVGVNHHGQSVLLGCGLLSSEDTDTFVWLFQCWLNCMSNCPPKAIITDQCQAMKKAIEIVFPNSRHRWCLWHIMKKIPEKLKGYLLYEKISYVLHTLVYDSYSKEEFEEGWRQMLSKYELTKNEWLGSLYSEKNRWVPIFVKDTFWAGMSTTQRSESMNAFFDGYVNSKTTLRQFVEQYDNALKSKFEKENQADFSSFKSVYECITHLDIEKQFQMSYTNAKFSEVQDQFKRMIYCHLSPKKEEGAICIFEVKEDIKVGESSKRVVFQVYFNQVECEVLCTCKLFEFRGILCGHSLNVLCRMEVKKIPSIYILTRWRKDVKRKYNFIYHSYCEESHQPRLKRFERLMSSFSEVAMVASNYDEVYNMVFGNIQELMSKVLAGALKSENRQLGPCSSKNSEESNVILSTENTKVYSPKSVRRKGRPPTKRKESTCDQKVRKANEKKKKMGDDPSSSLTPKDGGEVQNQERISLEWRMAPMFLGK